MLRAEPGVCTAAGKRREPVSQVGRRGCRGSSSGRKVPASHTHAGRGCRGELQVAGPCRRCLCCRDTGPGLLGTPLPKAGCGRPAPALFRWGMPPAGPAPSARGCGTAAPYPASNSCCLSWAASSEPPSLAGTVCIFPPLKTAARGGEDNSPSPSSH